MSHHYRVEIRANFFGTEDEVYAYAQKLASSCGFGGEVTAIFDAENDYEELPA